MDQQPSFTKHVCHAIVTHVGYLALDCPSVHSVPESGPHEAPT